MSTIDFPTNVSALSAGRLLGINNRAVSTSLERLSSGYRINSAADDPGGLSIAERLRAQHRGLSRASLNAQDGLSLAQTADAQLTEIGTLLQDMRESAVEAADGSKTSADRKAIQLEVEQFLTEIDRLSSDAEFNSKKLLDGTLGALTSSSDYSRLRAIITGDTGGGGAFIVSPRVVDTGALQRQLSDVFTMTGSGDMASQLGGITTQQGSVTLLTDNGGGFGDTGIYRVEVPNSANGSLAIEGFLSAGTSATLSINSATGAAINAAGVTFEELFQTENISAGDKMIFYYDDNGTASVFSITIDPTDDVNTWIGNVNTGFGAAATVNGTAAGVVSISAAATTTFTNVVFEDVDSSGSQFHFSLNGTSGVINSNTLYDTVNVSFANNGSTWAGDLTKTAANQGVLSIGDGNTGAIHARLDPFGDYSASGIVGQTDRFSFAKTGGANALETYARVSMAGAAVANGTYMVSAVSEDTFALYAVDNSRYTSLVNSGIDQDSALNLARSARIYEDGTPANNVFDISDFLQGEDLDDGSGTNPLTNLRIGFEGGILKSGERAMFDISTSATVRASSSTTLASLGAFQAGGVFSGTLSQELDLYFGDRGESTSVQLLSSDTLADAAGKISLAMWNPDGTGMIQQDDYLNAYAPPDLVKVNLVGNNRGSISIATPRAGDKLIIAGDDDLVAALGLSEVQAGIALEYSVSAMDAVSGENLGSVRTRDQFATGLVEGVTIKFDNTMNMRLDGEPGDADATNVSFPFNTPDETPVLSITASESADDFYLHVSPTNSDLQIGAYTGQTLELVIPEVSVDSLGLRGLNMATQETASEAIGTLDAALGKLNTVQSTLGAKQNRLESAIRGLDVAAENTRAAESRIRDVDYATEIIRLATAEMLAQSSSFALVQANMNASRIMQIFSSQVA